MSTRRPFVCLGRFERCEADWREPERYRDLLRFPADQRHIVQGSGLSLVGASFGDGVLVTGMRNFNRILAFDHRRGELHAEAGITLGDIFSFLRPRGFCVPVQPGYPRITLGGCIAGNAHGKNQYREGVFADIVREITLYHPAHGTMRLSRNENQPLFDATCGGYGLTGLIVSATIAVKPVSSSFVRLTYTPVASLLETVERMTAMRDAHELLYSWNDLGSLGCTGSGFIVAGQPVHNGATTLGIAPRASLDPARPVLPFNAFNRLGLTLVNRVFARLNGGIRKQRTVGDFDVQFPFASKEAYFYAYGSHGFIEHQVLIPYHSATAYIRAFETIARRFDIPLGLATFKMFDGAQKLLWFCGKGISFAIHVPVRRDALAFLAEVDQLDLEHGAIANVMKDSRLPGQVVRRQYRQFDALAERLSAHDPKRMFESALSRRVGL